MSHVGSGWYAVRRNVSGVGFCNWDSITYKMAHRYYSNRHLVQRWGIWMIRAK